MLESKHTSSTRAINAAIRKAGVHNIELRAGRGYQYLVYSDGYTFETHCEYVYRIRDYSIFDWIAIAIEFRNNVLSC